MGGWNRTVKYYRSTSPVTLMGINYLQWCTSPCFKDDRSHRKELTVPLRLLRMSERKMDLQVTSCHCRAEESRDYMGMFYLVLTSRLVPNAHDGAMGHD